MWKRDSSHLRSLQNDAWRRWLISYRWELWRLLVCSCWGWCLGRCKREPVKAYWKEAVVGRFLKVYWSTVAYLVSGWEQDEEPFVTHPEVIDESIAWKTDLLFFVWKILKRDMKYKNIRFPTHLTWVLLRYNFDWSCWSRKAKYVLFTANLDRAIGKAIY